MRVGDAQWNSMLWSINLWGYDWEYVYENHGDSEPPFPFYCFTVGLASKGLPEMIVVGLDWSIAVPMANELIERALADKAASDANKQVTDANAESACRPKLDPHARRLGERDKRPAITFVDAPASEIVKHCPVAHQYAKSLSKPTQMLQLVWGDQNGRFPFEEGADPRVVACQPVLQYADGNDPCILDSPGMA